MDNMKSILKKEGYPYHAVALLAYLLMLAVSELMRVGAFIGMAISFETWEPLLFLLATLAQLPYMVLLVIVTSVLFRVSPKSRLGLLFGLCMGVGSFAFLIQSVVSYMFGRAGILFSSFAALLCPSLFAAAWLVLMLTAIIGKKTFSRSGQGTQKRFAIALGIVLGGWGIYEMTRLISSVGSSITDWGEEISLTVGNISCVVMSLANLVLIAAIVLIFCRLCGLYAEEVPMASSVASDAPAATEASVSAPAAKDTFEELERYKELFDKGVITEEEFAAKKKQILGL